MTVLAMDPSRLRRAVAEMESEREENLPEILRRIAGIEAEPYRPSDTLSDQIRAIFRARPETKQWAVVKALGCSDSLVSRVALEIRREQERGR